MTIHQHQSGVWPLLPAILSILMITAAAPRAADPPDSLQAIRAQLPKSVSLDNKVVYVDFWASWCVPCRQSLPWMESLYRKYAAQGLEVVAVNVDKDHKAAMKFLENCRSTFPIVYDSTGSLAKLYNLQTMPSSFIYDREGHLAESHRGFKMEEADNLERTIQQQLGERKAP